MTPRSSNRRPSALASLLGALSVSPAGCASRRVPESFPPSSAASDEAREAPPVVITATLDAEPPLDAASGPESLSSAPTGPMQRGGSHHGH